jgi:hypothetical protein
MLNIDFIEYAFSIAPKGILVYGQVKMDLTHSYLSYREKLIYDLVYLEPNKAILHILLY